MDAIEERKLIDACLHNNRQAQFRLYELFAAKLIPVCRRYARSSWDAEDILQEGFIKAFRYLADFKNTGSFEGWLRRIMVTTAFNFYKKKKVAYTESELTYMPDDVIPEITVTAGLYYNDLMRVVNTLPKGYHQVFSLNAIEGYSHNEIGQMLSISANTSKSQLMRAKDQLGRKLGPLMIKAEILQTA